MREGNILCWRREEADWETNEGWARMVCVAFVLSYGSGISARWMFMFIR